MDDPFSARWFRKLRDCGLESIHSGMVTCGEWILPRDAAPCLSFDDATQSRRVWEVFGPASYWPPEDRARLASYRVIGSDGAGNPICIEDGSGAVWLLDHEDSFRTRLFINSSVSQLAECLLARMAEQDAEKLRAAIHANDPPTVTEGSFWWHEAAAL